MAERDCRVEIRRAGGVGLGEAFSDTIRSNELHRLIVEGATRILDAHGGALYVTDRTGGKLTPAFISNEIRFDQGLRFTGFALLGNLIGGSLFVAILSYVHIRGAQHEPE